MKKIDIAVIKSILLREIKENQMCSECWTPMEEGVCPNCGKMEEVSYSDSGLEHPEKADRNKDKKISSWEKKVGSAIEKNMEEGHEGQDHEVSMANNSLDSILWAAEELKKNLGDHERDIPAWIQDHITNAENYILQAAKNFHEYGEEECDDCDRDQQIQDMNYATDYEQDDQIMEAKGHKIKKMKKEGPKDSKKRIKERSKK